MSSESASHRPSRLRRRRLAPVAVLAGVGATAALALSMNGTLAGFTAQITNNTNNAATGTLVMQEQNSAGTVTCLSTDAGANSNSINTNSSTCSTINKYGGATTLVPGGTSTATITIKNAGNVTANTFTLVPGVCTQTNNTVAGSVSGSATDLCSKLGIVITETAGGTTTTLTNGTTLNNLTAIANNSFTLPAVTAGTTVSFTFTVSVPSALGNTYQGLSAAQNLVWSFSS